MNIFLDDEREPVNSRDFLIVRSYNEFVNCILENRDDITFITFDHDLGDDSLSGYECVKWLVELDMDLKGAILGPEFKWYVHSQNPVGAKAINDYLKSYMEYKFRRT